MSKNHKELTDEALELIAGRFKLLAEPMRLRILNTLAEREMSVGEIVDQTDAGQANVSKHLALLLEAGVVARRKDGLSVFYSIADRSIFRLCEMVCSSLGKRFAERQSAVKRFARR